MPTPRKQPPRGYHHGDLRAAMLKAAAEELAENGLEGFTLRSCARRAGVSHAAPAHHFGDVTGLLTEVAMDAFRRLTEAMRREAERSGKEAIDRLIAVALAYVAFALKSPAAFQLMFRTGRLDTARTDFRLAAGAAIGIAADAVGMFEGHPSPMADPVTTRHVIAFWSLCHGAAELLLAGQLGPRASAGRLAKALVPDMVRELFGTPARNDVVELKIIARASAAERR